MKTSTHHEVGRTDDGKGIDGVLSAVETRPSSLIPNAVAAGGLVAAMSFLTALGLYSWRGPGDAWFVPFSVFAALALAGAAIAAIGLGLVARSAPDGLSEVPSLLVRAWRGSVNGLTMFLVGCVLTLPVFALYMPVLSGDADSARLVASIIYVQRNGLDYLLETQEVWLPHLLFGPALALGGLPAVQALNALSVVLLGGTVGFISWRLTRSPLAVVGGVLALNALPPILDRAYRLPMYPTMLALGLLGVYFAHRSIVAETPSRKWQNAALAGLCLVLAFEAHQVGQLFLVVTALLVVTARPSVALPGLARVFLVVGVLAVPRVVVNLLEDGFSWFLTNRFDFWITKGYIKLIQDEFFDLPLRDSLGEYVLKLPASLLDFWGPSGILALGFGLAGLVAMSSKLRRFALVCLGFMLAVAVYRRLPFYTRYFSLLLVGSALAASVAFSGLLRQSSRVRWIAVTLGLLGLLASAALSYRGAIQDVQRLEHAVVNGRYHRFAKEIPPGEGVIGTRAVYLNLVSAEARTFGGQFLTEEEYVTFLTWPSEAAVIDLMRRHDIEWVFVPGQPWKWVGRYNDIWLLPNYGERARYHREIRESTSFCLVRKSGGAALYRLDPLGADPVPTAEEPRWCKTRSRR